MWNYIIAGYLIGCMIALLLCNMKDVQKTFEEEYPEFNPKLIAILLSVFGWVIVVGAVVCYAQDTVELINNWIKSKTNN